MTTYSIRMRSALDGQHISGAERLAPPEDLPQLAASMTSRALEHDKGVAETITISIDRIDDEAVRIVDVLEPVQTDNDSPASARELITALLQESGITAADEAVRLAYTLTGLRGAAIIDADTGQRLDSDPARGVRVSTFDAVEHPASDCGKDHFHEAIILASKVASAPGILAEICLSDDPFYTKGYAAVGKRFYRIPNIKAAGGKLGTRIFIVAPGTDIESLTDYLENQPVKIDLSALPPVSAESAPAPARESLDTVARRRNDAWADEGLSRSLRTFSSPQVPHSTIDGRDYLLFSSSDYLGLSTHDALIEAAVAATRRLGTGSGGSRLTTGTSIHAELERELASFFEFDDAVLFSTGYQANHSTIAAIAGADVEIFSDAGNHASIIDGCRAARARVTVFPHLDYVALHAALSSSTARHKLVISDAVFSMSGEVIDVPGLESTCRSHAAWLMLDDAHGVGVLGDMGRGTANHFGVRPDILVGTASKALGVEGGYVLCSTEVATLLRNQARSFVYSTSMNPGSVAAIGAALDQLRGGIVGKRLRENITAVRALLGLSEDAAASAILPLPVGDEARAMDVSAALAERGIFIPAIRYPTVARGEAMLRLTVTARHDEADIARLGRELKDLGLI
nr:6-carboxyhexanoate--CoA ligase [Corynebacterium lactis]